MGKGNQDILKALFGASFNALDNMVLSTSGFTGVSAHGYSGGIIEAEPASVPDSAKDNLRHVTAKLASVSTDMLSRQTARYGNYGDKVMLEPKKLLLLRDLSPKVFLRMLFSILMRLATCLWQLSRTTMMLLFFNLIGITRSTSRRF